jgi:hypothetical protein
LYIKHATPPADADANKKQHSDHGINNNNNSSKYDGAVVSVFVCGGLLRL